jgi:hypothetical protein
MRSLRILALKLNVSSQAEKNPEPRRHHYVPKCWLAGFTENGTEDGRLFVADLKRQNQWPSTPINAGHRRDFYRISVPNMEPTAFETVFGRIESFVAPTLKKLFEHPHSPTQEQLDILLYFAAVQWVRVPAFRPLLLKISESYHRSEISKALQSKESWHAMLQEIDIAIDAPGADYEGMLTFKRDVMDAGKYSLTAENDFFLLRGLDAVEKPIWPSLKARYWSTILSKRGKFIGSDNPVMMDAAKGKQVGFKSAEVILLIVNRFMMLCGTRVPLGPNVQLAPYGSTSHAPAHYNTFTMLTADEQLYSHQSDFEWLDENQQLCADWRKFSKDRIAESILS